MPLPPVPQHFGNPALGEFVEIQPLASIDWTPQTPGWYLVLGAALLWAGRQGWRRARRWHRNRYRREALRQLAALSELPAEQQVIAANRLLKTVAIAAATRDAVAGLNGEAWRSWLRARCALPALSEQTLTALCEGVYRASPPRPPPGFIDECRQWIHHHSDDHAV